MNDRWADFIDEHKAVGGTASRTHVLNAETLNSIELKVKDKEPDTSRIWGLIDDTVDDAYVNGDDALDISSISEYTGTTVHPYVLFRLPSSHIDPHGHISSKLARYITSISQEALITCLDFGNDLEINVNFIFAVLCIDTTQGDVYVHFPYIRIKSTTLDLFVRTIRAIMTKNNLLRKLGYDEQSTIQYVVPEHIDTCPIPLFMRYKFETYDYIPFINVSKKIDFRVPIPRYLGIEETIDDVDIRKRLLRILSFKWFSVNSRTFKKRNEKRNRYLVAEGAKVATAKSTKQETLLDIIGTEVVIREEDNRELLTIFLDMLSVRRMKNLPIWKILAHVIYNITEGNDDGLELLKEYTSRLFDGSDVYSFRHDTIVPLDQRQDDPNRTYEDDIYDPKQAPRIVIRDDVTQPVMRDCGDKMLRNFAVTCPDDISIYWSKLEYTIRPGIATVRHWVSIDSPQAMAEYKKERLQMYCLNCVNITASQMEIAQLIEFDRRDTYIVTSDGSTDQWYQLTEGYYKKISTSNIASYLSFVCPVFFRHIRRQLTEQMTKLLSAARNTSDEVPSEETEEDKSSASDVNMLIQRIDYGIKKCNNILKDLSTHAPKENIIKELKTILHVKYETFADMRDTNTKLVHYPNGVADLYYDTFRETTPDDWSTLCMKTNFRVFSEDDDGMKFLRTFSRQLFHEDDVREFDEQNISQMFEGGDKHKMITCHTGGKHNGKSTRFRTIERVFGDYFKVSDTAIGTGARQQSGSAKPDIVRLRGVRGTSLQEPGPNERFNVGVMKGMIDRMGGRGLYGKEIVEYDPQFVMHVILNTMITIPPEEAAFLDRIYVLYYLNQFSPKAPTDIEQQHAQRHYPANNHIVEQLIRYSCQQAYIWMKAYWRYVDRGMRIPFSVLHDNAVYAYDLDYYTQFKDRCVTICNDTEDSVSDESLFVSYREWLRITHPKETASNLSQFIAQMSDPRRLGPLNEETRSWDHVTCNDSGHVRKLNTRGDLRD